MVAVDRRVEPVQREPLGVQGEQGEDLGLASVEQQPLAVEVGLGGAEDRQHQARLGVVGPGGTTQRGGAGRHRLLDESRHHLGGGEADRVGAVPGGGEVEHAELHAGHRVVHGRGPADPVVHHRRVVLGAEDHRRAVVAVGEVQGVGAGGPVVPPAAGHEVHALGLAAHGATAVRPQDAGLRVGHGDHEVAVLGGAAQVLLDPLDRGLQRGVAEVGRGLLLVVEGGVGDLRGDRLLRARPARPDLGAHELLGAVTVLDERGPRAHRVDPASPQVRFHAANLAPSW